MIVNGVPRMSDATAEYWRLLRLAEDYFDGQTRSEREYTVPVLRSRTPAEETAREPGGDAASAEPLREQPDSNAEALAAIGDEVSRCRLCRLCRGRTTTVPGEGVANPVVMVIGEGPGAAEDRSGRPFVGPAGQYLDRWLAAIELDRRRHCFIANVVKCRPPGNRDPGSDEVAACMPYLARQIDVLRPRALLAVGRVAANHLLGVTRTLAEHRSGRYEHRGLPLFVTYHPSAVLRDSSLRAPVWEDLKKLRAYLDQA